MIWRAIGIGLAALAASSAAPAGAETLTASHRHVLADTDSRRDAHELAFMAARAKLLDEVVSRIVAGASPESRISATEARVHAPDLLDIRLRDSNLRLLNDRLSLNLVIAAEFEAPSLRRAIAAVLADPEARERGEAASRHRQKLEQAVRDRSSRLAAAAGRAALRARAQRDAAIARLATVRARRRALFDRFAEVEDAIAEVWFPGITARELRRAADLEPAAVRRIFHAAFACRVVVSHKLVVSIVTHSMDETLCEFERLFASDHMSFAILFDEWLIDSRRALRKYRGP